MTGHPSQRYHQRALVVAIFSIVCCMSVPQTVLYSKVLATRVATTYRIKETTRASHLQCGVECGDTADCRLFCVSTNNRTCSFYKDYVSREWGGASSGTDYKVCYSSWVRSTDAIKPSFPVTFLTRYSTSYPETRVNDGIAEGSSCSYYRSSSYNRNYIRIDMGTAYTISAVRAIFPDTSRFRNVAVYLGNKTSWSLNPILLSFESSYSLPYVEYEVVANTPKTGRYLFLVSNYFGYLYICEIQATRSY